mmetsp:Transcript_51086/g.94517  ORF Transcript_51086/g.94517 Transcript_51086/m.94517 type:complete len:89 (+) Transcript_51086:106-372(+)
MQAIKALRRASDTLFEMPEHDQSGRSDKKEHDLQGHVLVEYPIPTQLGVDHKAVAYQQGRNGTTAVDKEEFFDLVKKAAALSRRRAQH